LRATSREVPFRRGATLERRLHQPAGMETFSELLGADHRRLDRIVGDLGAMIEDGELERAEATFADFDEGLRRHIRVEEELLFPLFDRRTRMVGPSRVMTEEHRAMERLLDELGQALGGSERLSAARAFGELLLAIGQHNLKEERVLYPLTDRALPDDERRELVRRASAQLTPRRSTPLAAAPSEPAISPAPPPYRGAGA
jgi:iron-sulfur cluster repair protein YtfE (RIC family)